MSGCVLPFRHVEPAKAHGYTRDALAIPDSAVTFGVFVGVRKLSRRCLRVWRDVLAAVPNGLLLFSPPTTFAQEGILGRVEAAGIARERIRFIPFNHDESLQRARYHLIDLVLDTFPYSGGDTTLAAIDMGVPVVALCGKRHSERVTYSILANLGVEDTVCWSEKEYVQIACKLASEPSYRAGIREKILAALKGSALVDLAGYTRSLEEVFDRALEQVG